MARKITAGEVGGASVGGLNVTNSTLSAVANTDIVLDPQGTGQVSVDGNVIIEDQGLLKFGDSDNSNWVAFRSPSTVAANITWSLPAADATTANFSLVSDASSNLSFAKTFVTVTDNTTDAATNYVQFGTTTSGQLGDTRVSTTKLTFRPSTGTLTSTALSAGSAAVTGGASSTTTTSGALIVTGGVGISGAINVGGVITGDGSGITNLSANGRLLSMNVYSRTNPWDNINSDLSSTWSRPAGCNSVLVYVTGGGGGGRLNDQSYRGATGGAGGTAIKWITGVAASVSVTVGGGGGYARNGGAGTTGRTSSFGAYASAAGGGGGDSDYWYYGGEGGSASGGDVNIYGGGGAMGHGSDHEAHGGASFWGGGRRGHHAYQRGDNEGESLNGRAWGSGGANGYYSQNITSYGANGAAGIVVVFNYT